MDRDGNVVAAVYTNPALAVDGTDDVLVLGGVSTGPSSGAVVVVRLAAADGAVPGGAT